MRKLTISQLNIKYLIFAGLHIGHKTGRWIPSNIEFLLGKRGLVHILNLEQTIFMIRRSLNLLMNVLDNNGIIMFICSDLILRKKIGRELERLKQVYICEYWSGGMLTNFKQMYFDNNLNKEIKRLPSLICYFDMSIHDYVIKESYKLKIPTVALLDSNMGSHHFTYPLPSNNDATVAVQFYMRLFSEFTLNCYLKKLIKFKDKKVKFKNKQI